MNTILLLTKSAFNEIEFKNDLEKLGYEVLVSTQIKPYIFNTNSFYLEMFNFFQYTILSETLTNEESSNAIFILKDYSTTLVRKTVKSGSSDLNNCFVIDINIEFEDLRDLLAQKESYLTMSEKMFEEKEKETFIVNLLLSKFERKLFLYLLNSPGRVVPRKELCQHLWGKEHTSSNLSSLSALIKRIKYKLENYVGHSNNLKTIWGRGYIWKYNND
ncbi:helix-turn-helix domain-containing protein [Enterococcus raffinosus]|uniref:Helix-turn-helix domain-containing protein n=1 Tax=Enterococcus raffinosus TaxID=71452 RepID=A0AAW8TCE6_9ENTE|nr:helix-turn-helix domain-containing protein [Enterococcus raffinosus]MDT2521714.1 helix-turn-helix domain-containing protein [Enterococcus raffinosus]MDT2532771.1 helix-turn-helix domain-containing protein [Enterococcus raffinosus]MDT2545510.1 helix-turn-helix domain-containing protein [Enterococcus raffinosus]MDT2554652.1 helix-turn-helix domain-containing protein [Enterococcus raffinosus]MDT2577426.1 helix-turn-helix domain-containing protein [Enterococcus raffinosus]